MAETVTGLIDGEDQYTGALFVTSKLFNFSLWGTFVATVVVQRSFDGGTTWLDVDTFTAPTEEVGMEATGALYRAGVKTGAFTSGTANVRLSQ